MSAIDLWVRSGGGMDAAPVWTPKATSLCHTYRSLNAWRNWPTVVAGHWYVKKQALHFCP